MRRDALLIGVLVLVVRVLTFPRTPWDADELRFPFAAMVAVSIAASVVTAMALTIAFGPVAAVLFSFSAAVLVHAPAARPDSVAWMFIALAMVMPPHPPSAPSPLSEGRRDLVFGFCCAAAIAAQPQFVISVVAFFFAGLVLVVRNRAAAAIAFIATLLPFAFLYGAPDNLPWTVTAPNIIRFTLHPWGSKFIALPLLVCVAIGIRPLLRAWTPRHEVLMWLAFVHTAVGVAIVDPADGVRWSVPAMMFVAVVAAHAGWVGAAILAALSLWYTFPVLRDRVTRPSPPIQAMRAIPGGVIVLHDREMAPFAGGMPLEAGLYRYLNSSEPLLLVTSGNVKGSSVVSDRLSARSGAAAQTTDNRQLTTVRVFARPDHDAYGKLTRNAYRRVALIPIEHRFAPLRGVHGLERDEAGESWRWLDREAELRLPRGRTSARVELRLPADAAIDANEVEVNGRAVLVRRSGSATVDVPLQAPHLFIRARRVFDLRPPDTRRVAVQLVKVESR